MLSQSQYIIESTLAAATTNTTHVMIQNQVDPTV